MRPGQAKGAYTGLTSGDFPPIPILYDETIVMTATGFSGTAPTVNVRFVRVYKQVTVRIDHFFGTSNATSFTLTGPVPSWALPPDTNALVINPGRAVNDGIPAAAYGRMSNTDGTFTFYISPAGGGWTSSGEKGLRPAVGGALNNAVQYFSYIVD